MQKYLDYLAYDLEKIIVERWRTCVPHYYQAGIPSPFQIPPKDLPEINESQRDQREFEQTAQEIEAYLYRPAKHSMYDHFGIHPAQFPAVEKLDKDQIDTLTHQLLRLWGAFNYLATIPEGTPSTVIYPLLIERMNQPTALFSNGIVGIEFCHYDPEDCPFSKDYCGCRT